MDLGKTTRSEFVMQETAKKDIGKLLDDREGMDRALAEAVREAVLQHKRAGTIPWQFGATEESGSSIPMRLSSRDRKSVV